MTTHHVCVGGQQLSFGDDMSSVFREGGTYAIHHCQSRPYQLIMSFEQIDG
jgi:hypothetical protein